MHLERHRPRRINWGVVKCRYRGSRDVPPQCSPTDCNTRTDDAVNDQSIRVVTRLHFVAGMGTRLQIHDVRTRPTSTCNSYIFQPKFLRHDICKCDFSRLRFRPCRQVAQFHMKWSAWEKWFHQFRVNVHTSSACTIHRLHHIGPWSIRQQVHDSFIIGGIKIILIICHNQKVHSRFQHLVHGAHIIFCSCDCFKVALARCQDFCISSNI